MKDFAVVKKPSKKDRLLLKRQQREEMLKVDTSMKVTLECPVCKLQQNMTLEEYFEKINYGSLFPKRLYCEFCPGRPELMFYKVNMHRIKLAGFNWQRKREGITEAEMLDRLEAVDDFGGGDLLELPKKVPELE